MPVSHRVRSILSLLKKSVGWNIVMAGCIAIALAAIAAPSQAMQASVSPTRPQLGDTLSVVLPAQSTAPTVTMGAKTYPMFDMGNNRYRALLPTTPLDRPGNIALKVNADSDMQTLNVTLRNRSFPTQRIWLPPGKDGDGTDLEFDQVDAFKAIVSPQKLWRGKFIRPNNGEVTTGYGLRRYYNGVFANDYYHRGVDYAGSYGSAILAPAAGRVMLIGRESQGFKIHGNCIGIDHGQGVESIFLHLSKISVKEGDLVQAGQTIGALGNTGASTGPHLHWGLYVHGQSVDPTPWRTTQVE
ncbi:M23 family metallopeptidase [Myxacorys almedinensis]|uniref:Peptidoglycan DD-metalloendopeptidase family protein n=1 Tax=Myxacorys almedinensis A TaxID=2690445 RepID=A0A8J7Z2N5_9CYAN|nr:M23 family metallopeptidase [Myxacorys almedinensis]NDJ18899.1 peptidoglycan DD-metalloendopeptidase family protein [Myxacorys almedinensis A]